ncbi:hypothetical protein H5410_047409 [Solanum commersonii]|uniref:Uncharacterized protein n=1 Tax=Solanum commersonii TaxID=4109 RepID=A0A9J5XH75_SOLCO|nr:hypothetical protein H5410_047409 [Solanum commersonii]
MPIIHIGKMVFVPHHSSRQVELQNVYHVPELCMIQDSYNIPFGKVKTLPCEKISTFYTI